MFVLLRKNSDIVDSLDIRFQNYEFEYLQSWPTWKDKTEGLKNLVKQTL